jgi:anti-sigma regulatory factor (Ser/Thr protein kinase)
MTVTGAHTNASIHVVWELPSEPASVGLARRRLVSLMATHPQAQTDDAVLATSELVTNAIVHGDGAVTVHVLQGLTVLRVEVTDQGEATPLPRYDVHDSVDSGRGLMMVDVLATTWGVLPRASAPGTTVWFEMNHAPCSGPSMAVGQ